MVIKSQESTGVKRAHPYFLFFLLLLSADVLFGQVELKVSEATPWTEIMTFKGVNFSFIFYSEADSYNGGVVMRLENKNSYSIKFDFKVIFRSGPSETERTVSGNLEPGEAKTGSADGLFWIPWEDKRVIEQVGLRGYRISRS